MNIRGRYQNDSFANEEKWCSMAEAVGCPRSSHSPTSSLLIEPHLDRCSASGVNHDWLKSALATQLSSAGYWSTVEPMTPFLVGCGVGGDFPLHSRESHEEKAFLLMPSLCFLLQMLSFKDMRRGAAAAILWPWGQGLWKPATLRKAVENRILNDTDDPHWANLGITYIFFFFFAKKTTYILIA